MSSVFYIDQKRDTEGIFKRLKTLMFTLKQFDFAQLQLFSCWMKITISSGVSESKQKKISEVFKGCQEVEVMIANLTETIREELKRKESKGMSKVVIKLLTMSLGELPAELIDKIKNSNEEQLDLISDNIFQLKYVDEIYRYLD